MESDDFKMTLEVALQFFPGIKLKRENRNCARKPACQTKRRPQVFVSSGEVAPAQDIGLIYSPSSFEYCSENKALFVEGLQ